MERRRSSLRVGTVLVAVLVVLAGCNGLVPGEPGSESTPRETLTAVPLGTPAETPTATPQSATFDWFVDNGTVDMDALLVRHTETLGDQSFVLVWSRRASGGNGTVGENFRHRIAVENDTTYSRRETGTYTDGVDETYIDPSGVYRRVEAANGSVRTTAFPGSATGARTRFALLAGSVAELRFDPDGARLGTAERDGVRYFQLYSTKPPEYLVSIYENYEFRNFSSTIWVHPDGYVRTVQFEFTLVRDGKRIEVRERYTYTDVGETTLERPAWATGLDPGNWQNGTANGTVTPTPAPAGTGTPSSPPAGTGTSTPAGTSAGTASATPPGD
jgi:hypothetical protein